MRVEQKQKVWYNESDRFNRRHERDAETRTTKRKPRQNRSEYKTQLRNIKRRNQKDIIEEALYGYDIAE